MGIFDRPQLPGAQPNPEPPGNDITRQFLLNRFLSMSQNPYGMSPEGQAGINGPLITNGLTDAPAFQSPFGQTSRGDMGDPFFSPTYLGGPQRGTNQDIFSRLGQQGPGPSGMAGGPGPAPQGQGTLGGMIAGARMPINAAQRPGGGNQTNLLQLLLQLLQQKQQQPGMGMGQPNMGMPPQQGQTFYDGQPRRPNIGFNLSSRPAGPNYGLVAGMGGEARSTNSVQNRPSNAGSLNTKPQPAPSGPPQGQGPNYGGGFKPQNNGPAFTPDQGLFQRGGFGNMSWQDLLGRLGQYGIGGQVGANGLPSFSGPGGSYQYSGGQHEGAGPGGQSQFLGRSLGLGDIGRGYGGLVGQLDQMMGNVGSRMFRASQAGLDPTTATSQDIKAHYAARPMQPMGSLAQSWFNRIGMPQLANPPTAPPPVIDDAGGGMHPYTDPGQNPNVPNA